MGSLLWEFILRKVGRAELVAGLSDGEMKDVNICHVHSDITAEQLRGRNLIFFAISLALGIPSWLIVQKAEK